MADLFSLEGRRALVTGASRGIGRAIAVGLANAGADVVGVSANIPEDGGETGAQVRAAGRAFDAHRCDLGDRRALYGLVDEVTARYDRIDILVNNAGLIERKPAAEHGDNLWDRVLGINLTTPFVLARELGRPMLERGYGKVIFVASLLSFQGGINVPGYAASKGGVAQLTKALANEWAGSGVNVNALAPGYVATDNTRALREDSDRSEQILGRIPAGRWSEAADLAGPAVFLASDASAYVHGHLLTVDGGWMGR